MNTLNYIINKYQLRIHRRLIVEIPNMGRQNLAELFAELKFKTGAEIGVETGVYSEALLKANPNLHLFCIDPWKVSVYEPDIQNVNYEQQHHNNCLKEARIRLAPLNCKIIRKKSLDAVRDFPDNSLDFVYIDANHDFVNVTNDIHYWSKKVRSGGIVSGHDYVYFPSAKKNHVKFVVISYTRAYRINPLFIVGAEAVRQPGIVRDHYRSWFWVKT